MVKHLSSTASTEISTNFGSIQFGADAFYIVVAMLGAGHDTRGMQNSSGGKDKLGNISKRGDRYLRSLFTTGALAVTRMASGHVNRAQRSNTWPH